MRLILVSSVVFLAAFGTQAAAQEKQFSGPQPGERLTPFRVLQVTSSDTTKEVEIVNDQEKPVTLLVFMHKLSEPAIGLMMTLEWYAHQQQDLSSHFVMLTDDKTKTEQLARRWWKRPFFVLTPWSISLDGPEGPGRYGLNRTVDMTILIARDREVLGNFAIRAPNNTDAPDILPALAEALGRNSPSIDKIRAELRAARTRRRAMRMEQNPLFKLAPNAELGRLMIAIMNRELNSPAYVQKLAGEMIQWAGEDRQKRAQLTHYCKAVLEGDFELSKEVIDKLRLLAADE